MSATLDTPSANDHAEVSAILAAATEVMARLQAEITMVQETIVRLTARIAELECPLGLKIDTLTQSPTVLLSKLRTA